ncbi:hypothetical protein I5M32_05185 [Pedobacter sp. SD-b]|uniref:Uncharacterized protein n=1 Tax=Pedobacter segetis TaxID=2793069 RepID=A0ABS1BHL4_9SPHI|nr:hypothetical protein [Pedobacter segetis]MBK0382349.1 hypothetical protein [Pedobacter segetis]
MKSINIKLAFSIIFMLVLGMIACKKDKDNVSNGLSSIKDVVTTNDYVYNLATKKLTPDTSINANIKSEIGLKFIYSYLIRLQKSDSLINIAYVPADSKNDYDLMIPVSAFGKANLSTATAIKNVVKRVDNSTDQSIIKLTSFQPPLPKLENFPDSKLPDVNNKILITGKASSETGLKKIEILDDSQGAYTVVTTISSLNGAKTYDVNYTYTYRANTANLKIIATDNFDIKAEYIIKVPALPYTLYQNVEMSAQGSATSTVTNNHFFVSNGTVAGSCSLNTDQELMDFVLYGSSSSGLQFYNPQNAGNIAKNFKCGADIWTIPDITKLKNTRLKVLTPGDPTIDALYTNFNANNIPDLKDNGFFAGISAPSGNTAKYLPGTSGTFDATSAKLIWIQIANTGGTFTNCLMLVKNVVYDASNAGFATVKFDIYVQK